MKKLGIIDIGSNSMCMDVVRVNEDGSFTLIDEVKESVRLGDGLNDSGVLRKDRMEAAVDTLQFFSELEQALAVDHTICAATEAVRKATNRQEFLDLVKDQLGLEIRVLSGTEEAYYDYVGAVNSLILPDCLIMDIGGSSTELVKVIDNEIVNSVSLPIGSIMISQMFHLDRACEEQTLQSLHSYIKVLFGKIDWIYGVDTLIGIGGSFRNIAKIHQKEINYPLDMVHNYEMQPDTIRDIYSRIRSVPAKDRLKLKGLSKDRADILPGALAEISVLLDLTGISGIRISGSGLRDGLLYEWMLEDKQPVKDVFSFSVQNVMKQYEISQNHARQVWGIAQQLYHQLGKDMKIDSTRLKLLKAAALLHDSGISISYYDHHKHAFYVILNSRIFGLTHKELVMTAWMASIHRKSVMKIPMAFRSFLSNEEILTVQQLGVLLQIAESLDRRHNGNIYKVRSSISKDQASILLSARVSPGLELKDVRNAAQNFKKVFKMQLIIESDGKELYEAID